MSILDTTYCNILGFLPIRQISTEIYFRIVENNKRHYDSTSSAVVYGLENIIPSLRFSVISDYGSENVRDHVLEIFTFHRIIFSFNVDTFDNAIHPSNRFIALN